MALPNGFTGSNNGVTQYKNATYWKTAAEALSNRQYLQFDDETDRCGYYTYPGSPEGNVAADIGSVCANTSAGDLYVKTTDTATTGWKLLEQDAQALEKLTASDTVQVLPTSNNINVYGNGSITTTGSGNTLTAQLTGLTNHAVLVGAGTATITKVGPTATSGQVLQSAGSLSDPAFSTATYPATTTINQILYSSSNDTVAGLSTANNGTLVTSSAGVPSILAGPGTTGNILQSNAAAAPSFSTATYPSTATGTGTILRANGTNWVATTNTFPNTATTGDILYASATNVIGSLADVAVGQVLISGGVGSAPSYSATPTVTSITFGSGTALSVYAEGTWTPTLSGGSTAGTTVYGVQSGQYTRIGNIVIARFNLTGSSATGTGNALIGGLPFTPNNTGTQVCACANLSNASWVFPAGTTYLVCSTFNSTTMTIYACGSATVGSALQMVNAAFSFRGCMIFQV